MNPEGDKILSLSVGQMATTIAPLVGQTFAQGQLGLIGFMMTLGYQLGQVPMIRRNFEKAVLGVVFLSLLPMFNEIFKAWRTRVAAARV